MLQTHLNPHYKGDNGEMLSLVIKRQEQIPCITIFISQYEICRKGVYTTKEKKVYRKFKRLLF